MLFGLNCVQFLKQSTVAYLVKGLATFRNIDAYIQGFNRIPLKLSSNWFETSPKYSKSLYKTHFTQEYEVPYKTIIFSNGVVNTRQLNCYVFARYVPAQELINNTTPLDHCRETRQKVTGCVRVPKTAKCTGQKYFGFLGPRLLNMMRVTISLRKMVKTYNVFLNF